MKRLPASTRPALLVTAGVLLAVASTSTAYAVDAKTVRLSVDGVPRQVDLRGDTVSDVLAEEGLAAGPHDVLTPAADSRVMDGARVVLRHGRPLRLDVDGAVRTVWVTAGTVGDALREAGVAADGAALSADRAAALGPAGLALTVRLPKPATVYADGAATPTVTTSATVADLLAELRVPLRPADTVDVPLTARVTPGLAVTVTRVDTRQEVQDVPVPYPTVTAPDPGAPAGTRRVTQAGVDGLERRTYAVTLLDGVETGRTLVSVVPLAQPRPQLVGLGTAALPPPPPAAAATPTPTPAPATSPARSVAPPAGGGLDWAALARCESGGDPRAVSGNGLYYGLYQFSLGTWASVGGSGRPSDASPAEQTQRAQRLYASAGRSPWPVCGKYL